MSDFLNALTTEKVAVQERLNGFQARIQEIEEEAELDRKRLIALDDLSYLYVAPEPVTDCNRLEEPQAAPAKPPTLTLNEPLPLEGKALEARKRAVRAQFEKDYGLHEILAVIPYDGAAQRRQIERMFEELKA